MGILAGATTMMANAAGPVMVIYLLAMRLKKSQFIGTSAWYFWVVNLLKVPLNINLQLITFKSFMTDLTLLPVILFGALLGIILINKIPQRGFNFIVSLLATVSAVYLCVQALWLMFFSS